LAGGVFTEYLGWEWNFFVNVPIGLALAATAWKFIPESTGGLAHRQLDLPGAALVTAGLMSLVYGCSIAPDKGWTDPVTLGFLGLAVVLLLGFIMNERRVKHPLMPLSIFKVGNVAAANATQLFVIAAMFSMFFFLSLYVQSVLGYSPVVSGLSFLPITFIIGITSAFMPKLIARFGYKMGMIAAPLLMAGGLYYLSHISVGGSYWMDVFPGMVLMALGMGTLFISVTIAATSGVPARQSGLASGLLNTSQQVGGAVGLAVLTGVASAATASYMKDNAAQLVTNPAGAAQLALEAQLNGFQHAFLVAVGLVLIAAVVAALTVKPEIARDETADPAIHV
jgi:MFS family permease